MANAYSEPINFLQEFYQKYKFPSYFKGSIKLEDHDGISLHFCKCNFDDFTVTRVALQTKLAKSFAARGMVDLLSKNNYFENFGCLINEEGVVKFTSEPRQSNNPISALVEHCQEFKLKLAFHVRDSGCCEFAFECSVDKFFTLGQGTSKKLAKRRAAAKMCDFLKITYDRREPFEYECAQNIPRQENSSVSVLQLFCEFNDFSAPVYEVFRNPVAGSNDGFTVECAVEDIAFGRASDLTEEVAKVLAVERVFEDFIKEGYAPEIAEYMNGNLQIWHGAPSLALSALCFCFMKKPTYQSKKYNSKHFEVVCQVDNIKGVGKSPTKIVAKSMAATKVLEIFSLQNFPVKKQQN